MAPKEEKALGYPLGKTPSNSSPDTTTQTPDDHIDNEEEEDAPFQDEIFEENARGNTANPPTQHATQVEEKQSYILELIPTPKWSSPSKSVFDHFTDKLSTIDQKHSSEPPGKKQKVRSKKRKRKRDKKGKVSLGAPSHSAPSPERPDDNKEEEPPQGERHFQDEIFEEHEGKNRKIPPTQDAAQVEEKQCTAGQELIIAPPQSPSPLRFDFDDSSKKRKRKRDKKRKRKRDKKGKVSLGAPSHSAPSPERPDDNKEEEPPQGERHFQDEIFEEHEGKNRKIPPTQDAAQVEEKQCNAGQELIMAPPQSPSPLRFDFDDSSKKRKRKRNKKGKVSLGASSHSAPSPERPDDNKEEEPPQGERHFQDEIFKEHGGKSRKIPPTQDAAQVEEKQCTAGQELIIAPPQSPSPLRFDFDDSSEMSSTKNENPTSKSPRKEQKAGLVRSKKRRVGSAGDKEEAKGSVASSSSSGLIGSRVFTEEDEIAILEGMIDYGLSHNVSASVIGANVLREYLEGKLHSDFNKTQIYEKIRRFKQKLVQNMEIYKSSGEDPVFSKPHEAVVFDLSKKIWGGMDIDNRYSNTHAKDRISEDNGTDMKSKKNASRGKKNVARELSMKVGATAAAGDDVEAKVKKDHDDEEDHKDFVKNRLLEEIENVVKKLKVRLELAKLELDEMKE